MKFHPYEISHIYLDMSLSMPAIDVDQKGNYLVFWWKEIALGELFIESGYFPDEPEYYLKLITAIKPAIDFYSKDENKKSQDWENWILKRNFNEWYVWVHKVFVFWTGGNIPAVAPVSVIICTKNRPEHLKECLNLLKGLLCLPEQIVVVDNAPVDDATKKVVEKFEGVLYIKETRVGLDIARNTGINHSVCPVVAFTDDDVRVHPLWIYQIWETFKNTSVAAMTGLVIASKLDTEAQLIFERRWSFNRGYTDKIYDTGFLKSTLTMGPPVWEIGAGANMAFRKWIFEKAGNFNDLLDMGAAGCSGDSEMWFRILLSGNSIAYNPRAVVFHEHRKDLKALKKQIFSYMRGHTVAAMVQYRQCPESGYKNRIFKQLPNHYKHIIINHFPHFNFESLTTWDEIKGILSGLVYYYKNRSRLLKILR